MYAKTITAATGNVTPYIVAAGFYLIVTIPLTKLINTMEARMSNGRPQEAPPKHHVGRLGGAIPTPEEARSIRLTEMRPASQTERQRASTRWKATATISAIKEVRIMSEANNGAQIGAADIAGADAADETVIRIEDLRKTFGDNVVLRGIDLEVQRGEVVVILGPSARASPRCCAA